jgi:signal peptidase II
MESRIVRGSLPLLLAFLVGCDHATKSVAKETLASGRVVSLIRGVLDLRYTENFDTAFSLTRGWALPNKSFALIALAFLATAAAGVLVYRRWRLASRTELFAYTLLIAGAVGNSVERATHGYVVDFIHVAHWPVFNVADVLVVLGAPLLAIALRTSRGGGILAG